MPKIEIEHTSREGKTHLSYTDFNGTFEDFVGRAVVMASISTLAVRLVYNEAKDQYVLTGLTSKINREHRTLWTRVYTQVES